MTTTDIAGLCEKVRFSEICISALGAEVDRLTDALERQAAENKRLRLALAEAGMRIETCPGAYKSHVEIIVQKIRAALTGEDT